MIALFASVLPLVLQIVGFFIGKSAASDAVKTKFLELVAQYESEGGTPVRLGDSAKLQLEKIKQELAKDGQTQQQPTRLPIL